MREKDEAVGAFDLAIGIDYSGAATSGKRLPGLQVYAAAFGHSPRRQTPAGPTSGSRADWSRAEIAQWLVDLVNNEQRAIIGIDHAFSFPQSYFTRYGLTSWSAFLEDFVKHFPTHENEVTVRDHRGKERTGAKEDRRLCEKWTSSAKGVFEFDIPGAVANSTHAGIPWLRHLRKECETKLHFWPFDGWIPNAEKSLIVEVYPSILRKRYATDDRTGDEHDAYSVARWLSEDIERGSLGRYLAPPLSEGEKQQALLEGWILGIG